MKEDLIIKIPEGFKLDSFDDKTREIKLISIPKTVIEIIRTFDDVLNELGYNKETFKKNLEGLSIDEKAYRKLKLLAQVLNEGWEPNWSNWDEHKYYPWFDMESSESGGFSSDGYDCWHTNSIVSSRFCFKSRGLARYAGEQFKDLYEEYFVIKK